MCGRFITKEPEAQASGSFVIQMPVVAFEKNTNHTVESLCSKTDSILYIRRGQTNEKE